MTCAKAQWHLLPLGPLSEVVDVLTFGASKHGAEDYRNRPNPECEHFDAIMRHLVAYALGQKVDGESGKKHLAHVAARVLLLMERVK